MLLERLRLIRTFASRVHVDAVDGKFARGRTIRASQLSRVPSGLLAELHLMVRHPEPWIRRARAAGFHRIILHIEHPRIAALMRLAASRGLRVGLALSPLTPPARVRSVPSTFAVCVCLGVTPGGQGRRFHASTYRRLKMLRDLTRVPLAVDGGVTLDRVPRLLRQGVRELIVGSAIIGTKDPAAAYRAFRAAAQS